MLMNYHAPGYMLLYLLCVRMLTTSLAHAFSSRHLTAAILGCVLLCQALVAGYLIQADDLPVWVAWIRYSTVYTYPCVVVCIILRYVSPHFWMNHPILERELGQVRTFNCHNNPMITDEDTGIIKQVSTIIIIT